MAWTEPEYSRSRVTAAGEILVRSDASRIERESALAVVNNWRSAHGFPLNTFQVNLRQRARKVDSDALVAQRIKRLPSIEQKLRNFSGMKLARMNDIGGCRAVVAGVAMVDEIARAYRTSRAPHALVREDDYLRKPKSSGYRGIHLVYAYQSREKVTYNGLRIEVQLRSRRQHAWATAVETVGTFTRQALKSSHGEEDWLRFFALMGSETAIEEGLPTVPDTPKDRREARSELRRLATQLDVLTRLEAYGDALRVIGERQTSRTTLYLLELDAPVETLHINAYRASQRGQAQLDYQALERAVSDDPGRDVVLVSAESLGALRRAYPNYFLDTTEFLRAVRRAIA